MIEAPRVPEISDGDAASSQASIDRSRPDSTPRSAPAPRISSGLWTLLDQTLLSGTSLLAALAVGRALGDTGLGLYYLGFTVIILLMTILSSLISVPYSVRLQAMETPRRSSWLGSILVLQTLLLLLVVAALLITAGLFGLAQDSQTAWLCLSITAAAAAQWLREFFRRLLLADFRSATTTMVDGTAAAIQIALLAAMLNAEQLTVARAFVSIAIAHGFAALLAATLCRLPFQISRNDLIADCKVAWLFGRKILGASMIGVLQGWSIPWIIPIVGSLAISGRFLESLTIPLLINPLSMGLAAFLPPLYSRIRHREGNLTLRSVVVRHTLVLSLLSGVLLIAVAWKGVELLELTFDHPAAPYAWWTLILLTLSHSIPRLVMLPLEQAIIATERSAIVLRSSTVAMISTLILVPILTITHQELGAAIAIVIAMVFSESIKLWYGWRVFAVETPTITSEFQVDVQ